MHVVEFIYDLAALLLIAGFTAILFHRLKQPVVLGYILAGVIIGPFTPPFVLIHNLDIIKTLAELGVMFLIFSLGLEFSLRKLSKVGAPALLSSLIEIILMIWLGYLIGQYFNWNKMDSLFLGAILSISSTTIIVKALYELKLQREPFVQLVFGILIVEDILAIGILAILSSIAKSGSVELFDIFASLGKLSLFIILSLVLGILFVPRLLAYVSGFKSHELLLITTLALLFGFCLLVIKLQYSIALGAFMIGAIIAESHELPTIEQLIRPIRDMFSAIFFVSVGLLLNPKTFIDFYFPIILITLAVLFGKIISCSIGPYITGKDGKTALKVGMSLAQIGEFSFIIASLGISLNVTSEFLYPIAVAVSIITTFLTPYLMRIAEPLSVKISNVLPSKLVKIFNLYSDWLESIRANEEQQQLRKSFRFGFLKILVNMAIVIAIFLFGSYFFSNLAKNILLTERTDLKKTFIWGTLLLLSLPFLITIYRKCRDLSLLLAALRVKKNKMGRYTKPIRRILSEVIPLSTVIGLIFFVMALSTNILPATELLILIFMIACILILLLDRWFIKIYNKLQNALMDVINKEEKK